MTDPLRSESQTYTSLETQGRFTVLIGFSQRLVSTRASSASFHTWRRQITAADIVGGARTNTVMVGHPGGKPSADPLLGCGISWMP